MNNNFSKWQLGVTFGFRAKNGWFSSDEAKQEAKAIAESGADWVVLVVTVFQEYFYSTTQFKDFEGTPNDIEVAEMIDYLHSLGLKVQLRPMLETLDGGGRLNIWFPWDDPNGYRIPYAKSRTHWQDWFESMTKRAVNYARIAEATGCEMYCLDSELDRTIEQNDGWKQVIKAVREVYSGCLTSCHTTHTGIIDFENVLANKNHWFYDLDMLSLSCYHPATDKPNETKENMLENYKSQLERFRTLYSIYQKPIFFGECGCTSSVGGAISPSGFDVNSEYSGEEQVNYLSTVIETFEKEDWWHGLYWWKWEEQVPRAVGNRGFTLKDKPAIDVYKHWGKQNRKRDI
ncbi:MAG: hypothetical protein PHE51_00545 [Eubacteriales bacterium]|nr:hypothetical protein [Eubacteriales bacterium]